MEENKWVEVMPNCRYIDIKGSWDKKSKFELVSMIKEELMGNKLHVTKTKKLNQILNELKIDNNSIDKISQLGRNDNEIRKQQTYDSASKFLQFRRKDKIWHLMRKFICIHYWRKNDLSQIHILQNFCIRSGTLFNICQNLNELTMHWSYRKTN